MAIILVMFLAHIAHFSAYSESFTSPIALDSLDEGVVQQIHKLHDFLTATDRFTDYLDATTLLDFPIGIKKTIGNLEYVIAIDSVIITPTFAYLNASMSFKPPQATERLAFRGTNIKFTKKGGIVGDVRLELVGNQYLPIIGSSDSLIFEGDGTYVEWDCDGFKQFGLSAKVLLSRDKFTPISVVDSVESGDFVTASFEATVGDWNDLLVSASITPFAVVGVTGFAFSAISAVFDFSDLRNPGSVKFPENYLQGYGAGNENLWRGFYLQELQVKLPPQFKNTSGKRPEFIGTDIIMDEFGLSARLHGKNLLSLTDSANHGSMEGWTFSLDSIGLDFRMNRLYSAGFAGGIIIPIADKTSPFEYTAFIDHASQYFFNVSPAETVNFPLWQVVDVELYESSFLEVEVTDGRFKPRATLNGKMNIGSTGNESSRQQEVALANIEFEELVVQAEAPFLSAKAFSFGTDFADQKLGNFPVTINEIGLGAIDEQQSALDFDLLINLTPSASGSICADAGVSIISSITNTNDSWIFKSLQIKDITIDMNIGAFDFSGSLRFFSNDQLYGSGFNGKIDAIFKPGIQVEASALFGTVNSMRYWYADALTVFPSPVQVFPGFGVKGFGGGAYYRVKMNNEDKKSQNMTTLSGVSYVPDENSGLGLLASLSYSSITAGAFSGDVSFEINFFHGGGMQNISLNGNTYFMTPPTQISGDELMSTIGKLAEIKVLSENNESSVLGSDEMIERVFGPVGRSAGGKAQISAKVRLNYDFGSSVLHGNMLTYVNVVPGMVTGNGPEGRAGWAVMHFAPDDWHVMIGNPTNRLGLNFGIAGRAVQANGYFMVGTTIPGSPSPPEKVAKILGGIDLDYMRDENALGLGSGFALGAALTMNTGDLTFGNFYARFDTGAGFDLMLKNYGADVNCAGRSGPFGVNGWYANGQAYAYFDGAIGIKVDVFGDIRKIDIINVAAAAVLQAKLPSPFWMRGIVGGHFDVLGGLIKGECRFEVVIGEECEISNESLLSGLKVIAAVTPGNNDKEVNVFNNPQAVFNIPIGKNFDLMDIDESRKRFRIKLDHFRLFGKQGVVYGELKWNERLDVVAMNPFEILPPNEVLELDVQISFEEYKNGNWEPVSKSGNIIIENKRVTFTTGQAPDHIPLDNVDYSYPVIGMYNYYPHQYSTGYIKLKKGQAYLFDNTIEWEALGVFRQTNDDVYKFTYDYDHINRQVNFSIPELDKGRVYSFELLLKPQQSSGEVDRNVIRESTLLASSTTGGNIEVSTQQVEGNIDELEEQVLFKAEFRSSLYNTFEEKVMAFAEINTYRLLLIPWRIHTLRKSLSGDEYFDKTELEGNRYSGNKPLVQVQADLDRNEYFQKDIDLLIYADYPIDESFSIINRNPAILGLPPVGAVNIVQTVVPDGTAGPMDNVSLRFTGDLSLNYDLTPVYATDFYEIQTQAVIRYSNANGDVSQRISDLAFALYPVIRKGDYRVQLKYLLPDQSTTIADVTTSIFNPNKR
jgi:hypothetical protein